MELDHSRSLHGEEKHVWPRTSCSEKEAILAMGVTQFHLIGLTIDDVGSKCRARKGGDFFPPELTKGRGGILIYYYG